MPVTDSVTHARVQPARRGPRRPGLAAASTSTTSGTGSAGGGATPPAIVAVTAAGAVVTLNPVSGSVTRTLVPSGAVGDEIAVASNGTVYFTARRGCTDQIDAVPDSGGGSAAPITAGSLPRSARTAASWPSPASR